MSARDRTPRPARLDDTLADDPTAQSALPAAPEWVLTIAHHQQLEHVGQRLVLFDGDQVQIGRSSELFGVGALQDGKLSRQHASITREGDTVRISDLDSRNGCYVNGERIRSAALTDGDVLGLGKTLVLVHRGPRLVSPCNHPRLVGSGAALSSLLDQVALAAPRDVTVLIRGETGVGKELVARALHEESGRSGPFVAINCSAVADGVLQSELFGHSRGAFSGAEQPRVGLVGAAAAGTLFLDEIGDASPGLQASLLRLLEQREYRAVGSDAVRRSDARFVAATHVDLAHAVEAGHFRADLLSRLERWHIHIAPLRARREDILPLASHFARQFAGHPVRITRSLALALLRYDWPANVRELQSVLEQAVVASRGADELTLDDVLAQRLSGSPATARAPASASRPPVQRPCASELASRFVELDGNARRLAAELNIGRTTLYRWFAAAGIDIQELRSNG